MTKVVVFGECMVEHSLVNQEVLSQSFAGDVYNTAVYLKRLLSDRVDIDFLTAVGTDRLSEKMVKAFRREGIGDRFVHFIEDKFPGAYRIETSAVGDRSFTYRRDDAAAKYVFSYLNQRRRDLLVSTTDIFYFSGISIAILPDKDWPLLWRLLEDLRAAGCSIVFDTNYRPKLWDGCDNAQVLYEKSFSYSDIVFAGVEDLNELCGFGRSTEICEYLAPFLIKEVIIKNGPDSVICCFEDKEVSVDVPEVTEVVDSTSAGDSFNAGYLAGRLKQETVLEAVKLACAVSGLVIQYPGAIVSKEIVPGAL